MTIWGKTKDGRPYRKDKHKKVSGAGVKTTPLSDVKMKKNLVERGSQIEKGKLVAILTTPTKDGLEFDIIELKKSNKS